LRNAVLDNFDRIQSMDPDDARGEVEKLARQIHTKAKAEFR
jgi:hypothetical protein